MAVVNFPKGKLYRSVQTCHLRIFCLSTSGSHQNLLHRRSVQNLAGMSISEASRFRHPVLMRAPPTLDTNGLANMRCQVYGR
jgi:hypothetical protein